MKMIIKSGCYDCSCLLLLVHDAVVVMALAMIKMKATVANNSGHVIMAVMTMMMIVMAVIVMLAMVMTAVKITQVARIGKSCTYFWP